MSFRPRLLVLVNSKIIFHPWLSRRQAWPIDPRDPQDGDPPVNHQKIPGHFPMKKPKMNIPCPIEISHECVNIRWPIDLVTRVLHHKNYILIQHNPTVGEIIWCHVQQIHILVIFKMFKMERLPIHVLYPVILSILCLDNSNSPTLTHSLILRWLPSNKSSFLDIIFSSNFVSAISQ